MWLVVDTALPRAAVALVSIKSGSPGHMPATPEVREALLLTETKRHAERLPDAVDEVLRAAELTLADLEGIAVGTGPGSFIGIRTGLSFCKGLAAARGIPLVRLPSLLSLALSGSTSPGTVAVVDARRGERYLATLGAAADDDLLDVAALNPADAAARLRAEKPPMVVGVLDGVDVDASQAIDVQAGPTAVGLGRALARRLDSAQARGIDVVDERQDLVPIYLRDADAKAPATDPAWRRAEALATIAADTANPPLVLATPSAPASSASTSSASTSSASTSSAPARDTP